VRPSPLHALLQLPLLADLRELLLVVLAHLELLGAPPRVVLDMIHLLLPGLHQLVVTLAELLFLLEVCVIGGGGFKPCRKHHASQMIHRVHLALLDKDLMNPITPQAVILEETRAATSPNIRLRLYPPVYSPTAYEHGFSS